MLCLLFLARLEWSYVCEEGSHTTRMFATRLENTKKIQLENKYIKLNELILYGGGVGGGIEPQLKIIKKIN